MVPPLSNLKFDTAYLFVFILRYFHLVLTCQSHSQARRSRLNLELSFKFIPYHSRECNFQCLRSTIEIPLERISILIGVSCWYFFSRLPFLKKHFILTAQADDPVLKEALQKYNREGKTNNAEILERLLADYNITLRYDHFIVLIYIFLFTMAIVPWPSSSDIGTPTCMVVRSPPSRCLIKRRCS